MESFLKTAMRLQAKEFRFGRGQLHPALEEAESPGQIVIFNQPRLIGGDFTPDVDFIGDKDRHTASQGLDDGNAKVLLMGGKNENVGRADGAPFHVAGQHAGPGDVQIESELLAEPLHADAIRSVVGTGDDQMKGGFRGGKYLVKSVKQEIEALLFVNASEKKNEPLPGQVRVLLGKKGLLPGGVAGRRGDPIAKDPFVTAIKRKGFARFEPLLIGGEKNGGGIPQDAIFGPRPVEPFLEMLEGTGFLELGIKHSVRIDKIRSLRLV